MKSILAILLWCFFSMAVLAQESVLSQNSNLRSGPSSGSKLLASLPAGTTVTVVSKYPRSGYVRVTTEDHQTGWVWSRNVKQGTTANNKEQPAAPANPPGVGSEARVGDTEIYPKADQTPGKEDQDVSQDNIAETICKKGWSTASVRPPVSVTNKIKKQTMQTYGFTDAANHYELDHLISLQDGGCPDCVENLWPEAYGDKNHPMTQNQRATWNRENPGSTEV